MILATSSLAHLLFAGRARSIGSCDPGGTRGRGDDRGAPDGFKAPISRACARPRGENKGCVFSRIARTRTEERGGRERERESPAGAPVASPRNTVVNPRVYVHSDTPPSSRYPPERAFFASYLLRDTFLGAYRVVLRISGFGYLGSDSRCRSGLPALVLCCARARGKLDDVKRRWSAHRHRRDIRFDTLVPVRGRYSDTFRMILRLLPRIFISG